MVEVAYQLLDETDYVVASEETEPVCGWAYQYFLYDLIMQADNSPANLGKAIEVKGIITQQANWSRIIIEVKEIIQ